MLGGVSNYSVAATFLELRLAYFSSQPDSVQISFPNDSFPRFVVNLALLTERDFVSSKIVDGGPDLGKVVEVVISEDALIRFNEAAQSNSRPGLGLFVEGRPVNLFQMLHPLEAPELWLTGMSNEEMSSLVRSIGQ
ncbi:hypothetical protein ORJ04_22065 [Rheinheimera baltica]|uniref:Uncharacterized protein n=1 Tax=Rheinheimera baltica TaxID=67576 RepID=A0ABT9I5G2_9GAMM|nr:hypothetical protein [Rheinheimera baltica]MDP5138637.1 hypothetical protein [Rheinheimera baltica]